MKRSTGPRPLAERWRATRVSSVAKCHSRPYGIQPIDVESGHAMKGREVGERAVLGSIGADSVRVFLEQPEPDELLCIRRVDIDEAVPLGEKRQNRFLLPRFQLRAYVHHLREHALPTLPGPRSDEGTFRPMTATAPVQERLFAVLGTVRPCCEPVATSTERLRLQAIVRQTTSHSSSQVLGHCCRPRPVGAVAT